VQVQRHNFSLWHLEKNVLVLCRCGPHLTPVRKLHSSIRDLAPGTSLCAVLALLAWLCAGAERHLLGQAYLEPLVLAILLGVAVGTFWQPGGFWLRGIAFSGRTLLECGVMLLGLSISTRALMQQGPWMLLGIAAVVMLSIAASYAIGRAFGLSRHLSLLVACGNSICGNSAIAAVAPVIGAATADIASSIAFTAILGVAVVLLLPLLVPAFGLSATQYGVLAGLTVYAVPQVLAATVPVGALSVQVGTLVKLVRVVMLGPVVVALSLGRRGGQIVWARMLPWFILGFVILAVLRAVGGVPQAMLPPAAAVVHVLTVMSMAALGLGVDVRALGRVGARVMIVATLALVVLGGISFGLIQVLNVS
jgi:uncharacterized integral membrane protein (TIGR00698 family)